jgi:hypothetical protein
MDEVFVLVVTVSATTGITFLILGCFLFKEGIENLTKVVLPGLGAMASFLTRGVTLAFTFSPHFFVLLPIDLIVVHEEPITNKLAMDNI